MGYRGVQQNRIRAQFHGHRNIAGGSNTRVDNHRIFRIVRLQIFENDPQVIGVQDPLPRPDRTASGHHGGRSCRFQTTRRNRVIVCITKNLKSLSNQLLRRFQRFDRIRQQGLTVTQHLKLDPVRAWIFEAPQNLSPHPGTADCRRSVVTPCRIWKKRVSVKIDVIEDISPLTVIKAFTSNRHGDAMRLRCSKGVSHHFKCLVATGSKNQSALQHVISDLKRRDQTQAVRHQIIPRPLK